MHPTAHNPSTSVGALPLVLLVVLLLLPGCAKPPGVIFEPLASPLYWPAPPEQPRIAYVGQLSTSADLKPPRKFMQGVAEAIFGKKDVHSMLSPYAACTDGADRLFVADSNGQMVHVFNLNSRQYDRWKPSPKSATQLTQPVGLAYDAAAKRLIVSDAVAGSLLVFDDAGKFLGEIAASELARPVGLAIDPATRRLFVADVAAHQIVVLSPEGHVLQRLGSRGAELGQFNFPTHVALDSVGRLYVADTLNFRVQQFSPDLQPLKQIGRQGDVPGTFSQPKGLALDAEDHLYVIDSQFENIQIFDADGNLLLYFGEEGTGPGQFWLPAALHIDPRNRLWVADTYNRRIEVFDYLPEKK